MNLKETKSFNLLTGDAECMQRTSLHDLLQDDQRCRQFRVEAEGVVLDYARQLVTPEVMQRLFALAREMELPEKIFNMRIGERINETEGENGRAVAHVALRAAKGDDVGAKIREGDKTAVDLAHSELARIADYVGKVRLGQIRGCTGKPLKNFLVIGIGGSYLGTEFVYEALRTYPPCEAATQGRRLRFLSNVDPVDVRRALDGLDPESTLAIMISKSFTTAETRLNAKTVLRWLTAGRGNRGTEQHFVAISEKSAEQIRGIDASFGISEDRRFRIWEWVGGRYSVCSAVGVVPLSLCFGFDHVRSFLNGARAIDQHFFQGGTTETPHAGPSDTSESKLENNLPVILGLLGVWNSTFCGHGARAILPYCQALLRFADHIQQLDMESNGKRVTVAGESLAIEAGEINFGQPGTNGQHSFFQLMHQGRVVPADFIGFRRSQQPMMAGDDVVSNHDELMANFFAQPDALAIGQTAEQCPHKVFPGNRPSNIILFDELTPFAVGQLLALYEHRTAVQGFVWDINSFDQMGVELGKVMARGVREEIKTRRCLDNSNVVNFNPSTNALLRWYLTE